jgi:hypothetical protein
MPSDGESQAVGRKRELGSEAPECAARSLGAAEGINALKEWRQEQMQAAA